MFKRGKVQAVNSHPEPPQLEQIHKDINEADENDIVFTSTDTPDSTEDNINKTDSSLAEMDDSMDQSESSDIVETPAEKTYRTVELYLKLNEMLKNDVKLMRQEKDKLLESGINLKQVADEIKQKAVLSSN